MSLRRRLDRLGPPADPPRFLIIYEGRGEPGEPDAYITDTGQEFWRAPSETEDEFEARCQAAFDSA